MTRDAHAWFHAVRAVSLPGSDGGFWRYSRIIAPGPRLGRPVWGVDMAERPVSGYTMADLVDAYGAMKALVRGQGFTQDEQGLLQAVVEQLPGADSASISERRDGAVITIAASDPAARDADALQGALGAGPCVDAIAEGCMAAPIDLSADPRWPEFGTQVVTTCGFESMLSLRLLTDIPGSAYFLNVYGRRAQAFDESSVLFGLLVGTYASSVVLSSSRRRTILDLEKALQSNRRIGIAVGIIMANHGLTSERSFEMLRLASMNHNRKLRDIADSVVLTGTLDVDDEAAHSAARRDNTGPPVHPSTGMAAKLP